MPEQPIHLHNNNLHDNTIIMLLLIPSLVFFLTLATIVFLRPHSNQPQQVLSTQAK